MSEPGLEQVLHELEQAIAGAPQAAIPRAQRAMVLSRLGRIEEAIEGYDAALALDPAFVDAWFNKANLQRASGQLDEALGSYRRVLQLAAGDAQALNNMGVTLFQLGRAQEALECYAKAITLRPDYAEAYTNRGNALLDLGFHDEAVASHEKALQIEPGHVLARVNLGNAYQELGANESALREYRRALDIDQAHAHAHNGSASALLALDQAVAALQAAECALASDPDFVAALGNKGRALAKLDRCAEALAAQQQAYAIEAGSTQAFDVAVALQDLDRHPEALQYFESALVGRPDYVEALINRGNSLQAVNRHAAAVRSYQRAIEISPRNADAHWNEGLARLALGDYKGGWPKYEWRWRSRAVGKTEPPVEAPVWTGSEPITGKRVLLFHEQGYGDAIQFVRFARKVAAEASEVHVACHQSLTRLFNTATGVTEATSDPAGLDPDWQISLMSLPLALGTTLRTLPRAAYLRADQNAAARWQDRVASIPAKRRVGVVWAGNPRFSGADQKRCPVELLAPLLKMPGIAWISLQKEPADADRQFFHSTCEHALDAGAELHDFAATAACISALDLVITVDTAVAHLAGALGKPVWVMLPFSSDWRWLVGRSDSPWYPSARLFRQPEAGDWQAVVEAIRAGLAG